MKHLNAFAMNLAASGRLPMYLRLGVMALGLAGSLIGAELGIQSAFADGDDGGW